MQQEKKPDRTLRLNQELRIFLFQVAQATIATGLHLQLIGSSKINLRKRFSYSNLI